MRRRFAKIVILIGAVFYAGPGLWAVIDATSFRQKVEKAPPVHILHDMGVFMVGLGIWAVASLVLTDALITALVTLALVSAIDAYAHFHDLHMGGVELREPWSLVGMTALQLLGLVLYLSSRRQLGEAPTPERVPVQKP